MRTQKEHYYLFGPFRLDEAECRLLRDGLSVPLTPKAFSMLLVLVRNSGRLVEKDFLMQELWPDAFVEEANLTFSISVIRKALGESAHTACYIETVPKRGYRFIASVREVHAENHVKSLAVLPFVNLGQPEGSEYFADGIQEALISELAQLGSLRVISRTSCMQYKSATCPLPAFARALQLDVVIEGSVLIEGDSVRISIGLIDALNDQHLWAQSYERRLCDVLSWQSEVARSIARKIEVKVTPLEDARLRKIRSVDPETHAAYLRGRYYWHQFFTETGLKAALAHFRQAIELDPGYARAWSGMADCFSAMAVQSMLPPAEAATDAANAVKQSLALDPLSAEVHASMAAVQLFFEWNWASAERALKSALDLSPSCWGAHSLFTHYALARGWGEQAITAARRALDLDPLSAAANIDLAWAYLLNREYPKALEQGLRILNMKFNFPLAHVNLGQVYLCIRKYELAVQAIENAQQPDGATPAPILAMLGYAYGLAGKSGAAREIFLRMEELSKRCYVSSYDWAVLHTGLGTKDKALRCLNQAFNERSPRMIWLKVEPAFDSLRGDRHFESLVLRLGLE
jgi:TolB-like protein/Flp pilus assembly protein TadD